MEKLLNALRETLAKLGLDESAIEAALEEAVKKAESTEEDPQPGDPVEQPTDVVPPSDPTTPNDPGSEGGDKVPQNGEVPPVDVPSAEGDPVPPTDPVPPVDPTPAVPPFDTTELIAKVSDLQSKLEEALKVNDGLSARVKALEEGLKAAGVIDGNTPVAEVGSENPSAAPASPTEDIFGSVLNKLNSHKTF